MSIVDLLPLFRRPETRRIFNILLQSVRPRCFLNNMSSNGIQVLPPGFGYGIVIGIGGFFAALMLGITFLQNRYTLFSTGQSEEFNTASRNVKPGMFFATSDLDLYSQT